MTHENLASVLVKGCKHTRRVSIADDILWCPDCGGIRLYELSRWIKPGPKSYIKIRETIYAEDQI